MGKIRLSSSYHTYPTNTTTAIISYPQVPELPLPWTLVQTAADKKKQQQEQQQEQQQQQQQ